MGTIRLSTGSSARPRDVMEAVRGLKRMARLGRMAERALRDIEARGSSGPAPIVFYRDGRRLDEARIRFETFSSFREVERSEVPGYGEHRLDFGPADVSEISGAKVVTFVVGLVGRGLMTGKDCEFMVVRQDRIDHWLNLGEVRLKSNGQVNISPCQMALPLGEDSGVVRVYRDAKTEPARRAMRKIAMLAAGNIVFVGNRGPARAHELQRKLADWLLEDGHVAAWCRQILDYAEIVRVMQS